MPAGHDGPIMKRQTNRRDFIYKIATTSNFKQFTHPKMRNSSPNRDKSIPKIYTFPLTIMHTLMLSIKASLSLVVGGIHLPFDGNHAWLDKGTYLGMKETTVLFTVLTEISTGQRLHYLS